MKTRINLRKSKLPNILERSKRNFSITPADMRSVITKNNPVIAALSENDFTIISKNEVKIKDDLLAFLETVEMRQKLVLDVGLAQNQDVEGRHLRAANNVFVNEMVDQQNNVKLVKVSVDSYPIYKGREADAKKIGDLKGPFEYTYQVTHKPGENLQYKLTNIETNNIDFYNMLIGIIPDDTVLLESCSEDDQLDSAIVDLIGKNDVIANAARNVLDMVRMYRTSKLNSYQDAELEDVLKSTREFITSPVFHPGDPTKVDLDADGSEKTAKLFNLANDFQSSSRKKILGGVLMTLLAAAFVAAVVAISVLTLGIGTIPMAVIGVCGVGAAVTGGLGAFTLFKSAREDSKMAKSLRALEQQPKPVESASTLTK